MENSIAWTLDRNCRAFWIYVVFSHTETPCTQLTITRELNEILKI